MARLHEKSDSEEDFPELSAVLNDYRNSAQKPSTKGTEKERVSQDDAHSEVGVSQPKFRPLRDACSNPSQDSSDVASYRSQIRKQRPLKLTSASSLFVPTINKRFTKQFPRSDTKGRENNFDGRKTPRKVVDPDYTQNASFSLRDDILLSENDTSSEELSKFITDAYSGSDSESLQEWTSKRFMQSSRTTVVLESAGSNSPPFLSITDLTSPNTSAPAAQSTKSVLENGEDNDSRRTPKDYLDDEPWSSLRYSPPRGRSPHKFTPEDRPVTPLSCPARSKLQSPSKKNRIPPSPLRPSIDAFWSQEVINEWNDQHSPKKTIRSGVSRKLHSVSEDGELPCSPSTSPRKSPGKGLCMKDRKSTQQRKTFNEKKGEFASSFLKELDDTVANGQIATLASSTGGIRIVWSKKLNTTAGRANWKKEVSRSKNPDGSTTKLTYRHHATIELSEKVIDDEDRLYNVIAHEYCHLANFMISGVKNNPHGKEFKEWACKVTAAFKHRSITVTTKHSYSINYKYVWACTAPFCGVEFKRHSKSIDPARHSCGKCKSPLEQIKPVPRAPKPGEAREGAGAWREYVKKSFGKVREENPGLGMKGWMELVGKGFREEKGDGRREEAAEKGEGMDAVARELDFLNLGG